MKRKIFANVSYLFSLCAILLNLLTLLKTNVKNNLGLGITDLTGYAGNQVFSTNYTIRNYDVIGNNDDVIKNYLKNVSGKQTIDAKDDATKQTESYVSMCSEDLDARRTGNQLFNFAAMLLVARLTNRTAVLPATLKATWLDATFQVRIRRMADDVIYKTICPCYKFRERRSMIYDPRIRMLGGRQMKSLNQKGILLWRLLPELEVPRGYRRRVEATTRLPGEHRPGGGGLHGPEQSAGMAGRDSGDSHRGARAARWSAPTRQEAVRIRGPGKVVLPSRGAVLQKQTRPGAFVDNLGRSGVGEGLLRRSGRRRLPGVRLGEQHGERRPGDVVHVRWGDHVDGYIRLVGGVASQ